MRQEAALKAVFSIMALVLIASLVGSYWMGLIVIRKTEAVVLQQSVIDDLREFLSTMQDAETGQRGFLITGEDEYLKPHTNAVAAIQQRLAALDDLVQQGALNGTAVARLHSLSDKKLAELRRPSTCESKAGLRLHCREYGPISACIRWMRSAMKWMIC